MPGDRNTTRHTPDDLQRFAGVFSDFAAKYSEIAEVMRKNKIGVLELTRLKSFRRGIDYINRHLAAAMRDVNAATISNGLDRSTEADLAMDLNDSADAETPPERQKK